MKNKSLFSRLLENKKLMLLISFLIAFVFWLISSDNITMTIDNVQLNPVLSESAVKENLKIYSISPETVSVNVTGKRVIINSLTEDDFTANIDLFNVTKPGSDTYAIEVDSNSGRNFTIEGTKPLRVTIMVDKEVEKEVQVKKLLTYAPDGFYVTDDLPSTITIKGPESLISKVKSAYVKDTITMGDGNESKKTMTVHLSDNSDPASPDAEDIISDYIEFNNESLEATFEFLNIKNDLPVEVNFKGSDVTLPTELYTIVPSTISVAAKGDLDIENIALELDSLANYKNTTSEVIIPIEEILGDDLYCINSDVQEITVKLNFSSLESKRYVISGRNVSAVNIDDGYYYKAPVEITVIGTKSALEDLNDDSFSVNYDFEGITPTVNNPILVPATIKNNNNSVCWAYNPTETLSVKLEQIR